MTSILVLRYSRSAAKTLAKMPRRIAASLQAELERLAANPAAFRGDWKRLQGSPYWRLREGRYRAICHIDGDDLLILVLKIGVRGDICK